MLSRITKLKLHNFMSYKDAEVVFTEGVNVIAPLDSSSPATAHHCGKTTILRALRAVLLNEAVLDNILKQGESDVSVEVELSSGYRIERKRTSSTNQYVIHSPDGGSQTIDNMGSSIPEPVSNLTGVVPVPVGAETPAIVQLVDLWDPPFLVGSSGPKRAALLASLCGADRLRPALKRASGIESETKKEIQRLAQNKASVETSLKATDHAPVARAQYVAAAQQLEMNQKLEQDIARAEEAYRIIAAASKAQERKQRIHEKAEEISQQTEQLQNDIQEYKNLVSALQAVQRGEEAADRLSQIREYVAICVEADEEVRSDLAKFDAVMDELANWKACAEKRQEAQTRLNSARTAYSKVKEQIQKAFEEAGKCPTCGAGKKSWKLGELYG